MPGLREKINDRPAVAGGLALVLVVIAAGVIWWTFFRTPDQIKYQYMYNLETGQLESHPITDPPSLPPIKNEQGEELVVAHVYSMRDCTEDPPFVAWIERFTAEGKREAERRQQAAADPDAAVGEATGMVNAGREIAIPPAKAGQTVVWIPGASEAAQRLQEARIAEIRATAETGDFQQCWPEE